MQVDGERPRRVLLASAATLAGLLASGGTASAQTPASLQAAARYSAEREGDAVLVFRHDSLVLEDYQNGFDGRLPHALASGTKTFACAIAGLAVADSLLTLDEPVARTLPQFRGDSLKARVTIRHLLSLTSGLTPELTAPWNGEYAAALGLPMVARPGTRFAYGAAGFHVFEELMRRKLGTGDVIAYLGRRIFVPLGMGLPSWIRDGAGHPHLASGAAVTARDWGRLGLLLLDGGRWRGRQLLPTAAIAACRRGSDANPGYGLGVWLNAPAPQQPPPAGVRRAGPEDRLIDAPDLPRDLFLAAGTGGQRLYILPTPGLVVVRFGHNRRPDYKDDEFLRILLGR